MLLLCSAKHENLGIFKKQDLCPWQAGVAKAADLMKFLQIFCIITLYKPDKPEFFKIIDTECK